jgi:hypothetical protein
MTTRRTGPKSQEMGLLKTLLVLGSVAATVAGTRLLAVNEEVVKTPVPEPSQVIIIETIPAMPLPMPPTAIGGGQAIVLDLAPVPQAIVPHIQPVQPVQVQQVQPVAKTRSS